MSEQLLFEDKSVEGKPVEDKPVEDKPETPRRVRKSRVNSAEVMSRYQQTIMNTFGVPKRVFVKGEGVNLWDADGNKYLDLLAGIAVNGLGHAHPAVVSAVNGQLKKLGHVSNFFATEQQVALAERLAGFVTLHAPETCAKTFMTNSGTEANEAAFKVARMTGRKKIIAMEGSFHGRTLGALALTHNPPYREPFEPLPGIVEFVPFGDVAALESAVDDSVAAVVIEPIQGENGVVVPPDGFLQAARAITQRAGALLWLDEIQSGMGRTGTWLASDPAQITADIVTFAKGLGNGFPIGACVATGAAADLLNPGSHGTTFGGNPVGASVALAVIDVIETEGLMTQAIESGEYLSERLEDLMIYEVGRVCGRGLMRGIVLNRHIAPEITQAALDAGFVVNAPRPNVIRLLPPLIVSKSQLDRFIDAFPGLVQQFA